MDSGKDKLEFRVVAVSGEVVVVAGVLAMSKAFLKSRAGVLLLILGSTLWHSGIGNRRMLLLTKKKVKKCRLDDFSRLDRRNFLSQWST